VQVFGETGVAAAETPSIGQLPLCLDLDPGDFPLDIGRDTQHREPGEQPWMPSHPHAHLHNIRVSAQPRPDWIRYSTAFISPLMSNPFTLGVEEEFQIIDPETWDLRSHVSELLASGNRAFGENIKRELHQSIVEVGTRICENVAELAEEIIKTRRDLADSAERVGLRIAAAGTHPFADWKNQVVSPGERYQTIIEELQQLARSLLIFGLHIHVGMPDRETTIELMNEARYFLPHLLALSTSSPFWMGRDTGLKSFRTTVFRRFPRTGIPDHFGSWGEYESHVRLLVETHCIDDGKRIWWDLRPHPHFGTLEFRVCDVPTRPRDTIAIAALAQAILVKLHRLRRRNLGFRPYRRALIDENKWRASRWGMEGNLIDWGKRTEVPMRDLAIEILEFVDDVVDELGSRREVEHIRTIVKEGTSAERQLAVYKQTGDLKAVVAGLIEETRASVEQTARSYRI
jgi:carboxylate-amine ligase